MDRRERRAEMPVVFIHGVTVRLQGFAELRDTVQLALREHKSTEEMPFHAFLWGEAAADLRWGGASIPGFSDKARKTVARDAESREAIPPLLTLLLLDPLAELQAFEERSSATGLQLAPSSAEERNILLRRARPVLTEALVRIADQAAPAAERRSAIEAAVTDTVESAARTRADIPLPQLLPLLSRSLSASLYRMLVPPTQALAPQTSWDTVTSSVEAAVTETLGGQLAGVGDFLRHQALSLATLALRRGGRSAIMPAVSRFLGDVFVYLRDRETYLDGLNRLCVEAMRGDKSPLWLIGHSLGGVMAFDYCCRYPHVEVHRLATVGSQVGLFAEVDLLWEKSSDQFAPHPRPVPASIRQWINVYDENDMLSFLAAPIFDRVTDQPVLSRTPFPEAHGAYWKLQEVYARIFA
jgi:hypothetical protein